MTCENQMSHINSILKIAQCPECHGKSWSTSNDSVKCSICNNNYSINGHSINFTDTYTSSKNSLIDHNRALKNWGDSLHSPEPASGIPGHWHNASFLHFFGTQQDIFHGKVLELGCGAGNDSHIFSLQKPSCIYYALDIGGNIPALSKRDEHISNLHYLRGNCLNLPIEDNSIDSAISYGVFHHTSDPQKCMNEAFRVLRDNGTLCIYLYSNHENNIFKNFGIRAETALMYLTKKMSIKVGRIFCWSISPLILLLFSWPAQILKKIKILERLGNSFPLHWGTTPASIIADLQDRLLAPVNHRFSLKAFKTLFETAGFREVKIISTTAGHYGYGKNLKLNDGPTNNHDQTQKKPGE
jgi:SAM-dependent methyltransferase